VFAVVNLSLDIEMVFALRIRPRCTANAATHHPQGTIAGHEGDMHWACAHFAMCCPLAHDKVLKKDLNSLLNFISSPQKHYFVLYVAILCIFRAFVDTFTIFNIYLSLKEFFVDIKFEL
jgi:hypothetical protein